jgi:hypothetical protein
VLLSAPQTFDLLPFFECADHDQRHAAEVERVIDEVRHIELGAGYSALSYFHTMAATPSKQLQPFCRPRPARGSSSAVGSRATVHDELATA